MENGAIKEKGMIVLENIDGGRVKFFKTKVLYLKLSDFPSNFTKYLH